MKMKLFFIIINFYCYNFHNITYINKIDIKSENSIIKYSDVSKDIINILANEILDTFTNLILNLNYMDENLDNIYNEIMKDVECWNFIFKAYNDKKDIINLIAKKRVRNGFASNLIETEDECLESNEVYFLLKGNYTKYSIYNNIKDTSNQRLLFIERFTFDHELCLWDYCKNIYLYNNSEIIKAVEPIINKLFDLDHFELAGVNYKINKTTSYELEHKNDSYNYFLFIFFLYLFLIIL